MGKLFKITPSIRRLSANAIDTMIAELGKLCLLAYPTPVAACPNCHFDSASGLSNGVYNGTGPRSFLRPPCPVCRGKGVVGGNDAFNEVKFLIDGQPKPWNFIDTSGIKVPQGMLQVKGFVVDMPKVIQSTYMVVDHNNANYENNKFYLWGEPIPSGNIVANRYFIAFFSRSIK